MGVKWVNATLALHSSKHGWVQETERVLCVLLILSFSGSGVTRRGTFCCSLIRRRPVTACCRRSRRGVRAHVRIAAKKSRKRISCTQTGGHEGVESRRRRSTVVVLCAFGSPVLFRRCVGDTWSGESATTTTTGSAKSKRPLHLHHLTDRAWIGQHAAEFGALHHLASARTHITQHGVLLNHHIDHCRVLKGFVEGGLDLGVFEHVKHAVFIRRRAHLLTVWLAYRLP